MKKKLFRISIALLLCVLIGFLSSIATQTSLNTWYSSLNKPSFTPPNWIYGPTWVLLYILMGIAAGIVWSKGFYHKWVKTALYHFGFQLLLSAAWPIIFFGLQNPLIALLDIIALFILLLFTIKWFTVVNSTAAYLLIPYVIWVAFVTALNFGIWQLN
ncbi:TspO/MBR family protein [Aquimarina sediminis]|uniref:TspO/MBR family protein n=1 Tax=Aquimarina sediminis TaxID=2070536 RepID=UPI000CA00B24|nr:TspO/MBR family protein [Aquimarina sediminis]